jgi:hypothetical protein
MRWVIIFAVFSWFIYAVNKARQLGPLTEEEEFIPADHPVMVPLTTLSKNFTAKDEQNLKVQFFIGIEDINYENTSIWNASYIGEPIMAPMFNASCFRC